MTSRERIFTSLRHEEPDRVPLNVWMYRDDVKAEVNKHYGSIDAFYNRLRIDMVTAFPTYMLTKLDNPEEWTHKLSIDDAIDYPFIDPNDEELYVPIKRDVKQYREQRAVFCQTQGVFEGAFVLCGMENLLYEMALSPEKVKKLFEKIARWSCIYVDNTLDLGIDVPHISDDWGQNKALLFSPEMWWEMVYPNDAMIVEKAKKRCEFVSLHSDGYIFDVLDGVTKMGIDVVHPIQVSAGMDPVRVKQEYGDRLTLYGTLDITRTLPYGTLQEVENEVKNRMDTLKSGGGFIFCSTHTIQPDTSLERVEYAYDVAYEHSWYGR
jgi:uroporphyrinogen decarboxylase